MLIAVKKKTVSPTHITAYLFLFVFIFPGVYVLHGMHGFYCDNAYNHHYSIELPGVFHFPDIQIDLTQSATALVNYAFQFGNEGGLSGFIADLSYWDFWYLVVFLVIVFAGAGYLWFRRRVIAGKQKDLFARQLLDSMESERKRIASELHDSVGQELLIIKNRALLALGDLEEKKNIKEHLTEISNTASQALQETRDIIYDLRPYQIDRLGLTKAIESIIKKTESTTSIKFALDVDPVDNLVPKEMEIYVYRIVQECVNNIIKHSDAKEGRIVIKRWHNRLNIDVEDNGRGFDINLERSRNCHGLGLQGILERARLLGGTIRIESTPGNGTRVLMTIKTNERAYGEE
jgi:signal transduction histidine kinase